jgi:hypothetical protein
MPMLVTRAPTKASFFAKLSYHFVENPSGGNVRKACGLNEARTRTTSGASKKAYTANAPVVSQREVID